MAKRTKRQAAIRRRNIFLVLVAALLALAIAAVAFVVNLISDANDGKKDKENRPTSSQGDSSGKGDSEDNASKDESGPQYVEINGVKLDANFNSLLLVNADNPLPDDYDSNVQKDLVEIEPQYRNNNYVTKIHKDVHPYIKAMVAAAQAEGVDLRVWSPFRSYAIQKDLFQKQVNRVGGDEALAATVVARPGTSEHNTGLCADFNMASDAFETTEMYAWMVENAENYGFIMRYSREKKPLTGVIHESWHWRFVGINAAKEMNDLGMCLEEYVEYKNK